MLAEDGLQQASRHIIGRKDIEEAAGREVAGRDVARVRAAEDEVRGPHHDAHAGGRAASAASSVVGNSEIVTPLRRASSTCSGVVSSWLARTAGWPSRSSSSRRRFFPRSPAARRCARRSCAGRRASSLTERPIWKTRYFSMIPPLPLARRVVHEGDEGEAGLLQERLEELDAARIAGLQAQMKVVVRLERAGTARPAAARRARAAAARGAPPCRHRSRRRRHRRPW